MFKPKDQIVYIPNHVDESDYNTHPDCEFGFVTKVNPERNTAFCRYWSKFEEGELRTKSCGECTPIPNLRLCLSVNPEHIERMIEKYNIDIEATSQQSGDK